MSECEHRNAQARINELAEENAKLRAFIKRWIDATDRNEDALDAWERAEPDDDDRVSLGKAAVRCGDELDACEETARDIIGMER